MICDVLSKVRRAEQSETRQGRVEGGQRTGSEVGQAAQQTSQCRLKLVEGDCEVSRAQVSHNALLIRTVDSSWH